MSRQFLVFMLVVIGTVMALVLYHLNTDSPYTSEVFFGGQLTYESGTPESHWQHSS
ncbi:hypothetical protein [Bacterioplanes sanyensis]|uniref:hypothetical protein n=1 Tax=Bacterioplanes sanyensis TaxID=1249553 RepID=UPI0012FE7079|nr:hypothetical protein [Bacterioplanes sanyensis]